MTQTKTALLGGTGGFDDLTAALTFINQRRHTGVLYVHGHPNGKLFYDLGEVTHATSGALSGEEALHEIIRGSLKTEVEYSFYREEPSSETTISTSHEYLLFGLAKVLDENDERERRIEQNDPTALTLNTDPNVVDSLEVFKDLLDVPEDDLLITEARAEPQSPPVAVAEPTPLPPAVSTSPLLPPAFWQAVREATKDEIGPAGPTVMTVVARQRGYPLQDRVAAVPVSEMRDFLQAVLTKARPELCPGLSARLDSIAARFSGTF